MWLDPGIISNVQALEWIAKSIAKGLLYGRHSSQKIGSGMEFNQYRAYTPGDDLRLIDWKMYARTDKYYIRQSLVETEHQLICRLDNSYSMVYKEDDVSKLLLGKILSACLTLIAARQGDKFGLESMDLKFPLSKGMRHWHQTLEVLYNMAATENTSTSLDSYPDSIYTWITDLYYPLDQLETRLKALKNHTTELIVFHIIGEKEESLKFSSGSTFQDLETGQTIEVDPNQYRTIYQDRFKSHLLSCQNLFYRYGIHYIKAPMQTPADEIMKKFLNTYNYLMSI